MSLAITVNGGRGPRSGPGPRPRLVDVLLHFLGESPEKVNSQVGRLHLNEPLCGLPAIIPESLKRLIGGRCQLRLERGEPLQLLKYKNYIQQMISSDFQMKQAIAWFISRTHLGLSNRLPYQLLQNKVHLHTTTELYFYQNADFFF